MSVNWSWKNKMGEIDTIQVDHETGEKRHFKLNVYQANCVCALIYEWKDKDTGEDMYQFNGFFADFGHLRRCIGLEAITEYDYDKKKSVKKVSNMYKQPYSYWSKIKLNVAYPYMLKMAHLCAKAGFKVEIYYKTYEEK